MKLALKNDATKSTYYLMKILRIMWKIGIKMAIPPKIAVGGRANVMIPVQNLYASKSRTKTKFRWLDPITASQTTVPCIIRLTSERLSWAGSTEAARIRTHDLVQTPNTSLEGWFCYKIEWQKNRSQTPLCQHAGQQCRKAEDEKRRRRHIHLNDTQFARLLERERHTKSLRSDQEAEWDCFLSSFKPNSCETE